MTFNTDINLILDLKRRHDFVAIHEVNIGNPNGDMDADNGPRLTDDDYLFTTADCRSARIGQTLDALYGHGRYYENGENITEKQKGKTVTQVMQEYPMRALRGGVFNHTDEAAEDDLIKLKQLRAVLYLDQAMSTAPVHVKAGGYPVSSSALHSKKESGVVSKILGRRVMADYGVTTGWGLYQAPINRQRGYIVTEELLAKAWIAMYKEAEVTASVQRGGYKLEDVYIYSHSGIYGGKLGTMQLKRGLSVDIDMENRSFTVNQKDFGDAVTITKLSDVVEALIEVYPFKV
jgi:CRISPR/Cas system type I-B associated protein Csh2 (Cas7 group RAMP superfamily)